MIMKINKKSNKEFVDSEKEIQTARKETIKLLFMFSPSAKIGAYENYESK